MEGSLRSNSAVGAVGPPTAGLWISDVQRPMTAAEFAKMKGRGAATYFGVIGSRPIKNIRTNLPFPSASSRT
jgi:hypothetical protein